MALWVIVAILNLIPYDPEPATSEAGVTGSRLLQQQAGSNRLSVLACIHC